MRHQTTILLVDDQAILREGVEALLERAGGFRIIGHASNGRIAVELASEHRPDIVLMELALPELNGIEATRRILSIDPQIRVIALTSLTDDRHVTEMFDAGAAGYVPKTAECSELLRAITAVQRKCAYVAPDVAGALLHRHDSARTRSVRRVSPFAAHAVEVLTPKEREVLQLIAEGFTSKEIGRKLQIVPKTVESHRTSIMKKLDLHSIADLTRYAIREGMCRLE